MWSSTVPSQHQRRNTDVPWGIYEVSKTLLQCKPCLDHNLCVHARLLPYRHGSTPVNHSVTSFERLRLPYGSLLGSIEDAGSLRLQFLASIWRVAVGTLALSAVLLPAMKIISHITYQYSNVRGLSNHDGLVTPLISFPTQAIPIVLTVARAYALDAMFQSAVTMFMDDTLDPRVRHGVATCFKAISYRYAQSSHIALSERCGARGLFAVNQIVSLQVSLPSR